MEDHVHNMHECALVIGCAQRPIGQFCAHLGWFQYAPVATPIGGSASAGCIADVYRSAGSVRLAVEAQLARR